MITWILETDIFTDHDSRLSEAAEAQGDEIIKWDDGWIQQRRFPSPSNSFVVFHGSLGNASQITNWTPWKPGSFCTTQNYDCSAWYPNCQRWLLHQIWIMTTVSKFVGDPDSFFDELGMSKAVFVRPDSPLKPFSGRVIGRDNVSLKALDYGFYYEDENLPIVVAPVATVSAEWRFVVIQGKVVAGSAYEAVRRTEAGTITSGKEWQQAQVVTESIPAPDIAYVLDLCESEGQLRLLELNPFSGADHYACDRVAIVDAMSELAG